jgi:4a-hydroxytetrahydrobiopterin dehydratase
MSDLIRQACTACEGNTEALSRAQTQAYLSEVPGWELNAQHSAISRRVAFKNYYHTIAFVNAVAYMTHQQNHHPDLEVFYHHCVIRYSTHAIRGLSVNDFICAAKVNALLVT